MLRTALATSLLAVAAPLCAQISPFGICSHLHAGNEHRDHDTQLAMMDAAGIRVARADFSWGYFEPDNDDWRFEVYDAIVAASKKHNVTILPILCYNVDWAFPAHEHLDDWCDYVRTVVTRYKGDLKYWEVWNEPNIGFWKPSPDPAQYTELLKATYTTIKEIDPSLIVLYGGTAGIPFEFIRKSFELGAHDYFDVMAVHPYRYPQAPEQAQITTDLQKTWALLEEFGGRKPMWITEFGWPTHITPSADPAFFAQLIRYCAKLRFPETQAFKVAVLHAPGVPGFGTLGPAVNEALNRLEGFTSRLAGLDELPDMDPKDTQVLVMPTGEHYPADDFPAMLAYVKNGGLLAHLGGVPFYYAQRKENGEWKGPHAGEAARGPLHVGWKAWWTEEGLPEESGDTRLLAPEDSGIILPPNVKSTRWLTDARLQGNDKFVPLLAAYNGDKLTGYPVALYLYDSDLKGAFLGTILDTGSRGVTEDTQALYLPRAYMLTLGEGLEHVMWYEFRDGGDDATYNEHRFGIVRNDLTPKPAYRSMQVMTQALGAGKFIEKLDLGEGNYGYVFDAGQSHTLALWRAEGTQRVRLRVTGANLTACDYQGNAVSLRVDEGETEVEISPTVIYITGLETVEAP